MAIKTPVKLYGYNFPEYSVCRLSALCIDKVGITTGPFGSQLHQEDYIEIGTPIITVEHIGDNRIIGSNVPKVSEEDTMRLSRYLLQTGDIVFSRVGSVDLRSLIRSEEDGWLFSGRLLRVRPNQELIDPVYLSYFLGLPSFKNYMRQIAVGATMPSLNTKILSDVLIAYPDMQEQKAIASILGSLDDKIELNRQINEKLEGIAQALFKSWFIDFDPVRAKAEGRDTGLPEHISSLFPSSFVDSELGQIPEGWEITSIEREAEVIDCLHSKKPELISKGYPYIQLESIREDGYLEISSVRNISEDDYKKWTSRIEVTYGDCIITNVGRVGAIAQIPEGFKGAIGRNITSMRLKVGGLPPTFFIQALMSKRFKEEISLRIDSGTILEALNVKNIPKLRLIKPSGNLVHCYENLTKPVRRAVEINILSSITLASTRDTLLPQLISGELPIPDAERIVGRYL